VLQRLVARQAATQDELAANDLSLIEAQAEVTRLSAAKQQFERGVKRTQDRRRLARAADSNEVVRLMKK